jgi:hypothetical protein
MSSWLEKKYLNMLSPYLRNFKRKSENLYNWSCVFCGDSVTKPRRARAYAYQVKDKFLVTCHNCSLTTNIPKLVKHVAPHLYDEYVKELMMDKYRPKEKEDLFTEKNKKSVSDLFKDRQIFDGLYDIDYLGGLHPCKLYVANRKIPQKFWRKLYYSPAFMEWTNTLIPDKFSTNALKHDAPRLIIPFISKEKKVFGYQGRSLDPDAEVKYITIILDENQPKIFGMDTVDQDRKFFIFEGPLDSLFIPNSVACAGGELLQTASQLKKENAVLVFDNEPRSKETCKKMQKAINLGYQVCIWPKEIYEKDVNEMILSKMEPEFIKTMIDDHIYVGLGAQVAFGSWRKT